MNTKTLDQIKNEYYGEIGMLERNRLERELEGFLLCGLANRRLKELREAGKIDCLGAARASIYVVGEKLDVHSQGSQETAGL